MRRRILWFSASLCVLAATAAGGARRAASYLPASCWLTICYDGGHPGLRDTPLHAFLQEAEVQASLAQWQPLVEALWRALDEDAGFPASPALRAAVGTELAIGGAEPGEEAGTSTIVAAVRVGPAGSVTRTAFEALLRHTREKAKPDSVRQFQIGETAATALVDGDGDPHHYAFDGEFLVDASTEALLRRALDPASAKVTARLDDERAFLRLRVDVQAALKLQADGLDEAGRRAVAAFGLDAVRAAEVLVVPRAKRLVVEARVEVPEAAKATGLAKWLTDAPPVDRALLERVPRDAALFWATSMDLGGVWDTIWEAVGKADPEAGEAARGKLAELEGKAGLQVREAFLAALDRGTVVVSSHGLGAIGSSAVVVQRVKDPKKLEASLGQLVNRLDLLLAGAGGNLGPIRTELKPFQYRGHTCRYLWFMGGPALLLGGWAPCYANLGEVFVFARHPLDLKDYLDFVVDDGPSVMEHAEFRKLLPLVPEGASSVSYGEWSSTLVTLYNTVGPLLQFLQGLGDELEVARAPDVANLPSSRLLRRYAKGSVAYSVCEGGRYRMVAQGDGLALLSPHAMPVLGGAAIAAVALPSIGRARTAARRTVDMNNLRQVGMAATMCLNDRNEYPASLAELVERKYIEDPKVLVAPADPNPPKLRNAMACSYESCFDRHARRVFGQGFPAQAILAWDREGFYDGSRCVVFFDGHVELVNDGRFRQLALELERHVEKHTKPRVPKTEF